MTETSTPRQSRATLALLAGCVGAVSTCGIVYQLIVGTISTYLLGNSTFQFSLTIGLFMSAYGVGSFLSTLIRTRLTDWFAATEVALGLFGGLASLLLFYLYATTELFQVGRFVLIAIIGTLVGLEIPLLVRISEEYRKNLRITVGQMIGFDYIGALVGGIGFPLLLLPFWGLLGSSFLVGLCNVVVALVAIVAFRDALHRPALIGGAAILVGALLFAGSMSEQRIERMVESSLYEDPVVYLEQTPYQRIAVTKRRDDVRMFLDGSLQFSSSDEYRYHEPLVHPAATRLSQVRDVLVLGGGDGLALRELRHYPEVRRVLLIDLDPSVVKLARENADLRRLNGDIFDWDAVEVLHDDAFTYVREPGEKFDLVIIDLPDPHNESLAKLYSVAFYASVRQHLRPDGLVVAQLGSPFFARSTFWTGVETMRRAGLHPMPFHAQVPSFGNWGFALGGLNAPPAAPVREFQGRFYDTRNDAALFRFPRDMQPKGILTPNTLLRPVIVEHFRRDWRSWN